MHRRLDAWLAEISEGLGSPGEVLLPPRTECNPPPEQELTQVYCIRSAHLNKQLLLHNYNITFIALHVRFTTVPFEP